VVEAEAGKYHGGMATVGESRRNGTGASAEVVLVGRQLDDNENLGLGYLAAALVGLAPVHRLVLNRADELERSADAILASGARLVGLSLPDGGCAHLPLALGELLRRRGFAGHVTAGGPFATLARGWLLERYGWLGSVVRFAGEAPLRELVVALREGRDLGAVPGLTTRAGDGPPAPVTSALPLRLRPLRGERPQLLGHGVAHLQATRGCVGRCAYCGPAALQALEVAEGERAGVEASTLRRLGVGGVRRRPVADLCAEIAELYRDGVRYFYFVDEHVLPTEEREALAFLAALGDGLRRRGVGRLGFGCMLRAELLTERLVDAFADVGLVRAFLGVELATPAEGRRYRRRVDPGHARALLARLDAAGVAAVSNLMLIHPAAIAATIERAVDLMGQLDGGVVEATRMQVYHGTRLAAELARAGRLTGNPLRYGYRLEEPTAERFAELYVHLRLRAFGDHSVGAAAHALALAVALGERLTPERVPQRARDASRGLTAASRALYVEAYREALALAASPATTAGDVHALVARSARAASGLFASIDAESRALAAAFAAPRSLFAPMRAAASTSLVFAMAASAAACGGATSRDHDTATGGSGGTGGAGTGGLATGGTGGLTTGGTGGSMAGGTGGAPACDAYLQQVVSTLGERAPCFEGTVSLYDGGLSVGRDYGFLFDCVSGAFLGGGIEEEARVVAEAVPGRPLTGCDGYLDATSAIANVRPLLAAAADCGWDGWSASFVVVVDASGVVTDVTPGEYSSLGEEGLACLRTALAELAFPCFPSTRICPEEVIIE